MLLAVVLGCCGISRESWLLVLLYASACGLLILLEVQIAPPPGRPPPGPGR